MDLDIYVREGRLDEAITLTKDAVRGTPAAASLRFQLAQLFTVAGDWKRAHEQFQVASELEPERAMTTMILSSVLQSEGVRADVMAGRRSPLIFGEPEAWMAELAEAMRLFGEGQFDAAERLRETAFDGASSPSGSIGNVPFEWIADADSRLGPLLEAFVNGKYFWVPFSRIARLDAAPPADLLDTIWFPVEITWTSGGKTAVLLPVRYAGSESSADPLLRLGRSTAWQQRGENTHVGLGQRILVTDAGEYPLLEVRTIVAGENDG